MPVPSLPLSLYDSVAAAPGQLSCDLAGEAAILQVSSGIYYTLDPVGAKIWSLLQHPTTIAGIRDAVVHEFDVAPARCEADLFALLTLLHKAGLIEVHHAPPG